MEIVPLHADPNGKQNGYGINGGVVHNAEWPLPDETKIHLISNHFLEIMKIIGLDVHQAGLKETPRRVATMYVKELFSGLNTSNKPQPAFLENNTGNKLVIEKNITLHSICEHHFLPIIGKVHVAYLAGGKIIRLSKLNRIVQHCSKKPQVQQRLMDEIAGTLKAALDTQDVAVIIDATHLCVTMRGVRDLNSSTITSHFSGKFQNEDLKMEFLLAVK